MQEIVKSLHISMLSGMIILLSSGLSLSDFKAADDLAGWRLQKSIKL